MRLGSLEKNSTDLWHPSGGLEGTLCPPTSSLPLTSLSDNPELQESFFTVRNTYLSDGITVPEADKAGPLELISRFAESQEKLQLLKHVCELPPCGNTEPPKLYVIDRERNSRRNLVLAHLGAREAGDACEVIDFESRNSTVIRHESSRILEEQLDRLFVAAEDEQFEQGMESRFAARLQSISNRAPLAVLVSLSNRLMDPDRSPEVLAEMLCWTARQDASAIRGCAADILRLGLRHSSPIVRDSAMTGLACLLDNEAVVALRQALEEETVPEVRQDLEDLILSLDR
jgi:hypothetical protein